MRSRAAFGIGMVLSLVCALPLRAAGLEVDPSSTRLEVKDAELEATLAFRNGHRIPLRALVTAELVDSGDNVVARGSEQAILSGTAPVVRLPLLPVAALHAEGRRELLLQRLRYRIEPTSSSTAATLVAGTLAVSAITPDVFELRLGVGALAGRIVNIAVRSAHPVTGSPVGAVTLEVRVRAHDSELEVAHSATTDADGRAVLDVELPEGIESDRVLVSVVGRKSGFVAALDGTAWLTRLGTVRVSTDMSTYRPGARLNVRALARVWGGGPAAADASVGIEVVDGRGHRAFETQARTSRFGVASVDWVIPPTAPEGDWTVRVGVENRPGGLYEALGETQIRVANDAPGRAPRTAGGGNAEGEGDRRGPVSEAIAISSYERKTACVGPKRCASLYLKTTDAEGSPVSCDVSVSLLPSKGRGSVWSRARPERRLTTVHTNNYGVARVDGLDVAEGARGAEDSVGDGEAPDEAELRLRARDAAGHSGSITTRLRPSTGDADVVLEPVRTIHASGEPARMWVRSRTYRGPVLVEMTLDGRVLESRVIRLLEASTLVEFPYRREFSGLLSVTVTKGADLHYAKEGASAAIVYAKADRIRVDLAAGSYAVGQASVRFDVRDEAGHGVPAAIGVAVVGEDALASGLLGAYREGPSLAGVTLESLAGLDPKSLPEGLDLVAEVLLWQAWWGPTHFEANDDYADDVGGAFTYWFEGEFEDTRSALEAAFVEGIRYPENVQDVRQALATAGIDIAGLRDPWGRAYRSDVGPSGDRMLLAVRSVGPDGLAGTSDDLAALSMSWRYAASFGRQIVDAIRSHYSRTERVVTNTEELRIALGSAGVVPTSGRDPWGRPYRLEATTEGADGVVRLWSAGPDGRHDASRKGGDDVLAWTLHLDGYERVRERLQRSLDRSFADSRRFPQTEDDWAEIVGKAGGSADDLWGRNLEATFRSESAFAQGGVYANLRGGTGRGAPEAASRARYDAIALLSVGPDGARATADDVEVAYFRRLESEMVAGARPVADAPGAPARGRGGIAGSVVARDGTLISWGEAVAVDSVTGEESRAGIDGRGQYLLADLRPGLWRLDFHSEGFAGLRVTEVPVAGGQLTPLHIELETAPYEESKPDIVRRGSAVVDEHTVEEPLTISVRADGADSRRCAQSPREVLVWEPALETDATGGASVRLPPEGGGHGWRLVAVASTEAGQVAVVERKLLLLANDTACATGSGREVEKR